MSLTPVKSASIKAMGYDAETRSLTVEFHSGATHAYQDVSSEKFAALMAASTIPGGSIGKHFHAHIKSAHKSSKV